MRGAPGALVAGAGPAGAILACLLRRRGVQVCLLERARCSRWESVELISARATRAFLDAGFGGVLRQAGATLGPGFWNGAASPPALYLRRDRLAAALLAEAVRLGARHVVSDRLPTLAADRGAGEVLRGDTAGTRIAVDATGRAARWVGAVERDRPRVASLFRGPGRDRPEPPRVVRSGEGWAYSLAHPEMSTVGIVARTGLAGRAGLDGATAAALGLADAKAYSFMGYAPACVQWAQHPVRPGLLAVGDAALAYDPLSGQGLRFALASAGAALLVIERVCEGASDVSVAEQYYREFLESARRRHLRQLAHERPAPPVETAAAALVVSDAPLVPTVLRQGDALTLAPAVRLRDGELARWVGGVDLLSVCEAARQPITLGRLTRQLAKRGIAHADADSLVRWCLARGVLSTPRPDSTVASVKQDHLADGDARRI